ncbi:MAG: hypothetical protein ABI690_19660 [Chloroflexota bacterium]
MKAAQALEFTRIGNRYSKTSSLLPISDLEDAVGELMDVLEAAWEDGAIIVNSYKQSNTYAIHWPSGTPFEDERVMRLRLIDLDEATATR